MPFPLNFLLIGLAGLFLTIPIFNTRVFRTVNLAEVIVEGRDGLAKIQELLNSAEYDGARDSADALIQRFRNDSTVYFVNDISSWDTLLSVLSRDSGSLGHVLLAAQLEPGDLDTIKAKSKGAEIGFGSRRKVVRGLNRIKDDLGFFVQNQTDLAVDRHPKISEQLRSLSDRGALPLSNGRYTLSKTLSDQDKRDIRRFNMRVLEAIVFPRFLSKDPRRNTDWASEYTAQTAMYYVGASYKMEVQLEKAIMVFDSLISLYPKTMYAEMLFLQIGQMLYEDGRGAVLAGNGGPGSLKLSRAIGYLQSIEKNRDVARDFPKYKHVDLRPDHYVNVDAASKAKRRVRQKTSVYTLTEAKEDLSGKADEGTGGNTLEDAVKLIGECYTLLGKTDSARMQYKLLLDFFPESDNLDDAQKLIADSYVKDGDLAKAAKVSGGKAEQHYLQGIKEFQKFVNVYPQSDLISDVYIAMGDAYTKLGKPDMAARSFASAIDLAKEIEQKAKIQLQIGDYYFMRKQYQRALDGYSVVLKNYSGTQVAPDAYYRSGECRENLGDTANALEAYRTIVDLFKNSKSFVGGSAYKLGMYYFKQGDWRNADTFFTLGYTYDDQGPLTPKMMIQKGAVWIEIAKSQEGLELEQGYKAAIKALGMVVEKYPGTRDADEASFQIAECFMKIGNEKAAREATKKIANRDVLVNTIKIFGVDVKNNDEELKYWEQQYADAMEDEERATILYEKAMLLTDKMEKYDEGLASFQKVLELTKQDMKKINASVGLARVYTFQNRHPETQAVLLELLENPKVSAELSQQLRIQLYDSYFRSKEWEKSLDGFESFAAQFPDHDLAGYAYYRIGMVLAERKEHAKAKEKLQVVIDKYKKSKVYDKAILGIAEQMIALGQAKEGVDYLLKFMKDHHRDSVPAAVNIYLRIAETYTKVLNEKDKALRTFSLLLDSFPENQYLSYAAYQRGTILKEQGKDQEAIESFSMAKKEDGALFRASQAEIGRILAKTDPEAAIANYQKIVESSETAEDSAVAMIGTGDVYVTVKKWKEASQTFRKVYEFYHGHDTTLLAGALVKWVDALNNSGQHEEAIKAADIMQERFPQNEYTVNTVYFEASAFFALKRFGEARKRFVEIVQMNKSEQLTEVASYQKADCNYFSKNYESAVREYEEYLRNFPKGKYRANALYMQGNAYWTLQDFSNARTKFQAVVSGYPDFGDICNARNFLAYSLNRLDKWREAIKLYNEVLGNKGCSKTTLDFAREQREAITVQH